MDWVLFTKTNDRREESTEQDEIAGMYSLIMLCMKLIFWSETAVKGLTSLMKSTTRSQKGEISATSVIRQIVD